MNILIKGMDMPKEIDETLNIQIADGIDGKRYARYCLALGSVGEWHEMEELPLHGRLIDADALMQNGWKLFKQVGLGIHEMPLNNPSIPTIIEAEGE